MDQKQSIPEERLTDWQKQLLRLCKWGAGVSCAPQDITKQQRQEGDELVAAGMIRTSKNHSADKHGMYVALG